MIRLIPSVAILALFLATTVSADEKSDAELKALVGKWKVEKAELGGKDITEHLKDLKFEIRAGGKYTVEVGEEKDEGSFTVEPGKTPKAMDVKPTGGPHKGKLVKAIYKLDGNALNICYDFDTESGKRPEKFESKEGTMLLLITYKRAKK
jgi:uncharacterized protein (TIGR03067 family)